METNFGGESHRINLKSGRNFLQTYYAGSIPTGGSLRFGGLNYIRRAGNWVFNNGAVDMGLTQWYVPYVYSPDRLTLKKDETKEGLRTIVFTVIGEEDQTDHTLIFRLDKDSNLTEIKETGYMRPTGSTPTTPPMRPSPPSSPPTRIR